MDGSRNWVEDAPSKRRIDARVTVVGEDLVVVVGGGEKPHVGCVVLAQPCSPKNPKSFSSASTSVLTIPPHKEEPIARGIAERLAVEFGRVAVVTAGIHDDDIDAAGIAVYLRLGEELAEKLVVDLRETLT